MGVLRSMAGARFAAAIMSRHPHARGAVRPVARVLRRAGGAVLRFSTGRFTFSPRLEVALRAFGRLREPQTVTTTATAPLAVRSLARAVRDEGAVSRTAGRVPRTHAGRASDPARAQAEGLAPSRPVPRVLRRHAPTVTQPAEPVRRDEGSSRPSAHAVRPQPLSPVEMERLTDHIVLTIDRRIAAFRERQGRT
jgi:hypothetical protein